MELYTICGHITREAFRLQGMSTLFNDLKVINNNIQNKKRHENNKTLDTHLNDKKVAWYDA